MAAGRKQTKKSGKGISPAAQDTGMSVISPAFLTDVRHLITETRSTVAVTVIFCMTLLYWRVGVRIRREILRNVPPREVLAQKLEGSSCDAQRAARCTDGGEMMTNMPAGARRSGARGD